MQKTKKQTGHIPTVSHVLNDGRLVELVYDAKERRTALAVSPPDSAAGDISYVPSLALPTGETLVPVKPRNNLIRHKAVLLPERAEEFGTVEGLLSDIGAYIDRYVDLSESFRDIAVAYVLFSWVYDAFNELPYLRFRGDFGSGKTRALQVIGGICYKPFFASGASTVSPIFHTLDLFRGTLLFDETDFRFSDERSEIIKIFNNGNVRGMPVLRTMVTPQNEFDPRAFSVFGPKLVSMRHRFDDDALESRFLTEEMGCRKLRADIPINLPDTQETEAAQLRNRLLMYRFRHFHRAHIDDTLVDAQLSARTNQILTPLFSLVEDGALRVKIQAAASALDARVKAERADIPEALVLEVIQGLIAQDETKEIIPVQVIAGLMRERYASEFERPISNRYIGSLVRTRLHLPTYKTNGIYVVPLTKPVREQVSELCKRFGIGAE
ncbi:MAG: hypothetical protein ACXWJZ_03065 [Burkholderiaceae bacterium]